MGAFERFTMELKMLFASWRLGDLNTATGFGS